MLNASLPAASSSTSTSASPPSGYKTPGHKTPNHSTYRRIVVRCPFLLFKDRLLTTVPPLPSSISDIRPHANFVVKRWNRQLTTVPPSLEGWPFLGHPQSWTVHPKIKKRFITRSPMSGLLVVPKSTRLEHKYGCNLCKNVKIKVKINCKKSRFSPLSCQKWQVMALK